VPIDVVVFLLVGGGGAPAPPFIPKGQGLQ
jgi:hypothetical protein